MTTQINWLPQNESKDSWFADAHKKLKDKYGLKRSRGMVATVVPGEPRFAGTPKQSYTGDVMLSTGKQLTKAELTTLIRKLL